MIDFKRNSKDGIPAKVERIEYDPNRTAHIALLCYADGARTYIIATKGMAVGDAVMTGSEAPIKSGNCLPIRNIPVGTVMNCVEMLPGKGAQMARTAGAGVVLMAREGTYAQVRLRSGEVRRVHIECRATVGEVGNAEHSLRKIGKAGAMRWRGVRPTVRGVVMNPVDHPHGGGEGKTAVWSSPCFALGPTDQRQEDSQQQAYFFDDRLAPRQEIRINHDSFIEKRAVLRRPPGEKSRSLRKRPKTKSQSKPGPVVRPSCLTSSA